MPDRVGDTLVGLRGGRSPEIRSDDLVTEKMTVGDQIFSFSLSFSVFEGFLVSPFEFPQKYSDLVKKNKV